MSKNIFRKIAAFLLAVALIVPGFAHAFANPSNMSGHPLATDPNALGSITVHIRTLTVPSAGMPTTLPPGTPLLPGQGVPVEGVPTRITRVALTNFNPANPATHPTAANLADPVWIQNNTTNFTPADVRTGFTNASGTVAFENLPQGIWLVEQLDAYDGRTNPIPRAAGALNRFNPGGDRFNPFLVGIPTHIGDTSDYGDYRLDVEVWPKIDRERLVGQEKTATNYFDNIITWDFGVNIPNTIGTAREFYLLDVLDPRLTFTGASNVTGRFSTNVTGTVPNLVHTFGNLASNHFTVSVTEVYFVGQGYRDVVRIALTPAGIAHIFANGVLETGRLYFTMGTTISGNVTDLGEIRNEAQWRLNPQVPWDPPVECPPEHPYFDNDCIPPFPWEPCPYDDPECYPVECPVNDPDCYPIITERLRTLGLNILKLSTADRQRLQGAVFHLYRQVSAAEATALNDGLATPIARVIPANASGAPTAETWIVPLRNADGSPIRGTTGATGEIQFNGIVSSANSGNLSGMFWLREYQAPTGFQVIDEWMPVQVEVSRVNYRNANNPFALGTLTAQQQMLRENGRFVNNVVHVNVYNERAGAWQLPGTGAVETIILTVIGVSLLGSALVLVAVNKKRRKNSSAA